MAKTFRIADSIASKSDKSVEVVENGHCEPSETAKPDSMSAAETATGNHETEDVKMKIDFDDKWSLACASIRILIEKSNKFNSYILHRINTDKAEKNEERLSKKDKKGDSSIKADKNQPSLFSGGILHPYQIDGFQWMKLLYENGLNGILADEMGLGKTAQSIAMVAHLVENGISGPFLVSAPLSTLPNWVKEFHRFAPKIPTILYHGDAECRKRLIAELSHQVRQNKTYLPVIITSYSMVMIDAVKLRSFNFKYFIIDECHRLKNYKCKLFRHVKQLTYENLLLLTGTPLQNDLSELWSLLNIALPQIFSSLSQFEMIFDTSVVTSSKLEKFIATEEQKHHLIRDIHQLLTPYILRRTKADVKLNLPAKKEIVVYAHFTPLQQQYYTAVIDDTIEQLLSGSDESILMNEKRRRKHRNYEIAKENLDEDKLDDDAFLELLEATSVKVSEQTATSSLRKIGHDRSLTHVTSNKQMMMRQISMHPYLLCYPMNEKTGQPKINEDLVLCSGKMKLLDTMLAELRRRGHKVLIFSQMVRLLDILVDYCSMRKYPFSIITGNMNLEERIEEMEKFDTDPNAFLFLLSTKAGGLGVNLTTADTVILYDSDWNPQNDLQAQDRCHRIGQSKPVLVYRFITKGSVDESMLKRAITKRKIERLIIKDGCFNSSNPLTKKQTELDEDEIITLFNSCNVQKSISCEVVSEENLRILMDRSTSVFSENVRRDVKDVFMTVN